MFWPLVSFLFLSGTDGEVHTWVTESFHMTNLYILTEGEGNQCLVGVWEGAVLKALIALV